MAQEFRKILVKDLKIGQKIKLGKKHYHKVMTISSLAPTKSGKSIVIRNENDGGATLRLHTFVFELIENTNNKKEVVTNNKYYFENYKKITNGLTIHQKIDIKETEQPKTNMTKHFRHEQSRFEKEERGLVVGRFSWHDLRCWDETKCEMKIRKRKISA